MKWRGSAYRINFDLHRAGGLWLWLLLLVFAWSSVYMNLSDSVYAPVTRTLVGEYHEPCWIFRIWINRWKIRPSLGATPTALPGN
uniref:PepSY domain-containing protein n=1 Tax=Methylomonas koyamae TaxID=702114 RepID=UPI00278BD839|nr:PepSY domain-containing protein [Methylomonas koyamae]